MDVRKPTILALALAVGSATIAVGSATIAAASEKPMSTIRKAAIERLQKKLGSLRGSIAPEDRNILLTNRMIDMLKPVRQTNRIRGSRGFDNLTTAGTVLPIDANPNLYSVERKNLHSGFTPAAGAELPETIDDHPIVSENDMIEDHSL